MSKRYFLVIAVAVILAGCGPSKRRVIVEAEPGPNPWTSLELNNDPDNFQFAIISDRTGGRRPGVFADAIRKLNLLQPEFVINVGDLIGGYTENVDEINRQWDEIDDRLNRLEMPFFFVPGNHDLTNPVELQVWNERRGRPYYHFLYRDVLFLCLCSDDPYPSKMGDEQIEYFRRVIEENQDARWTFVFMHRPLWIYQSEFKQETGWERFEPLIADRPHTVIAGHMHRYVRYIRNRQDYLVLSTTGGGSKLRGPLAGEFDHVVWTTMTDDGPRLANLMLEGIWDQNIRSEQVAKMVDQLIDNRAVRLYSVLLGPSAVQEGRGIETSTTLRLANTSDVPLNLKAAFQENPRWTVNPAEFELVLEPSSDKTFVVSLSSPETLAPGAFETLKLDWSAGYDDAPDRPKISRSDLLPLAIERQAVCRRATVPVVVDGVLDEWPRLPYAVLDPIMIQMDPTAWTGPDDASFRFDTAFDDDFFYLAVETVDDTLILRDGLEPWLQDGIEVRLDARPQRQRAANEGWGENDTFLFIALSPAPEGGKMTFYQRKKMPEGLQAVCARTPTGFVTEIAVPRAYLDKMQKKSWEAVRLNVAVDDYDDEDQSKQGAQIWWRPDWRSGQTYWGSGTILRP